MPLVKALCNRFRIFFDNSSYNSCCFNKYERNSVLFIITKSVQVKFINDHGKKSSNSWRNNASVIHSRF